MEKQEVRLYFDRLAPQWDVQCCHSASAIERILSLAQIGQGDHVLDVGCGTGVLFPYYLSHGVSSLLGVDLSPEMISFAKKKVSDPRVSLVCADAETYPFPRRFHQCMIYSAFPHFPNPDALLKNLAKALLPNGRITVAHSEGRKTIDMRHLGSAHAVSRRLEPAEMLAKRFAAYFSVDTILDEDSFYLVSGVRHTEI